MQIKTATLGYPQIGKNREVKKALAIDAFRLVTAILVFIYSLKSLTLDIFFAYNG